MPLRRPIPCYNGQQHHICVVIGLLMCNSTLRRPLPSICGTADRYIDPAINYVMPECFRRASIPLDSRLRGNDGLHI